MYLALPPTTRALPMRPDPPDRRRPVRAHKPGALSRDNLFNLARAASQSDCWVSTEHLFRQTNSSAKKDMKTGGRPPFWCRVTRAGHLARCAGERTFPMATRLLVDVKCGPPKARIEAADLPNPQSSPKESSMRHHRCPPCASLGTRQLRVWASARARTQTRHQSQRARWALCAL